MIWVALFCMSMLFVTINHLKKTGEAITKLFNSPKNVHYKDIRYILATMAGIGVFIYGVSTDGNFSTKGLFIFFSAIVIVSLLLKVLFAKQTSGED